jgi:hypothetical protein
MAEKHKSKYKAPKDLEKSQKPKSRKDLKDYTEDDKKGALNPKSTGDKQSNVLRKTDKEVVDNGKLDIKYNDDDRLYKSLEDGEYDPKTAAKRLKKRQDKEEKDIKDVIKDKIENLTREGKERLVREYIRRTFVKRLIEAEEDAAAEKPEEEAPDAAAAETPATPDAGATPDANATTTPDATATPETGATPDASATTTPDATAGATPSTSTTPAASGTDATSSTPAATGTEAEKEEEPKTPEEKAKIELAKQEVVTKDWTAILSGEEDPAKLIKTGFNPLGDAMANLSRESLRLAKVMLIKQIMKIKPLKKEE